jgi:hypothetical protein
MYVLGVEDREDPKAVRSEQRHWQSGRPRVRQLRSIHAVILPLSIG